MVCAYWFSDCDGTTEYQTLPVCIGRRDVVDGEIRIGEWGLHGAGTAV
jgi:hypothetical protein